MPTIKIVNVTTGEEIQREMNAEELAQWEKDKEADATRKQTEAEVAVKRAASLAKLEALGLDEDDLKALGL